MRHDITHMMAMQGNERYVRVLPNHWKGGFYEVITNTGGADIVVAIFAKDWQERNARNAARLQQEGERARC